MRRIEREIVISASPAWVWPSLIDERQLSAWFGARVALEARKGGRASFQWPDGRERTAIVELLDPGRRLVLRWSPVLRLPGGRSAVAGPGRVDLTVAAVQSGTLVRVLEEFPDAAGDAVGDERGGTEAGPWPSRPEPQAMAVPGGHR